MKRTYFLLILISSIVLVGLTGSYFGLRIWIKSDFDKICNEAMEQYASDNKSEALILVLKSESQNLNAKNHAIWALGHLKDNKALPVLKELQTGTECDHGKFVCQRELNRTIGYLEGTRINIMRFK